MVYSIVPRLDNSGEVGVNTAWEQEYFESRKMLEDITASLPFVSHYMWRQIVFKLGVLSRGQHHLSFRLEFV